MFDGLMMFLQSLAGFMKPMTLFNVLWATQLGIIIGMLPGLTATMGVALLTTLTFKLPAGEAILILICNYVGAIYGGSRSAILLNIPGTPANAATAVDGHPLAQQGLAGRAIGIATTGSFLGSVVGIFCLAVFTPLIGNFALNFQSFEFFTLAIFGVVICGNLTAPKDPIKGWIAGFLGLFVAMIGMEGIHAHIRFSFGNVNLAGGIDLIPAMVGVFGFSEIIMVMKNQKLQVVNTKITRIIPKLREVLRYWKTIIRSGIIGVFVGAIPGVGEDIGAWVSYDFAKNASKEPEKFGKGSYEGLISAECGNNAACGGTIIPVLSLGIPGSAPAAVLMAAMFIHGVRPGPLIMVENPEFVFQTVAMVLLATVAMFVLGLSMVKWLVKVLQVPREKLMPIIFVLCVIGAFALESNLFDVTIMVVFGLLGFLMKEMDYPVAPLVLGIILGDILDKNLRRALIVSEGNILQIFNRPISLVIIALTILTMLSKTSWFRNFWSATKKGAVSLIKK
ncbi:transporter [Iocasia frigidifontis]|uniref:Transporter n=1 Tax=Iocasia fonsfrigidae TaxID=2682810 RepID=A0A8A7KHH7_9FIRM|nr:tripartite tricarboxylate transporter permease [Iocasia fonsfrigidae]QTL97332.1 transporter [Iocasia fonsfrigidae]